jgi:pimeloyl-ACP methyl ester carboxylesterase
MTMTFDLLESLPKISVPTLVIGCNQDTVRPAARSAELARMIPGSTYAEASWDTTCHCSIPRSSQAISSNSWRE